MIGGTKFYERAEIKDAIAYLDAAGQPVRRRSRSSASVNSPRRGIGDTTQGRIVSHANTIGESVWDVALAPEDGARPGRRGDQGGRAVHVDDGAAAASGSSRRSVGDLIQEMLTETGYMDALRAERTIEAQGRIENLEELVGDRARVRAASAEEPSLEEFLERIALFADTDSLSSDEGVLTLMTLHNAKGLEFPIVFIIGMEEGVFPHMRSIEAGDVEEERRLAYVGVTRAMRELYLTYAEQRSLFGTFGREHALALPRRDPRGAVRRRRPGAAQVVELVGPRRRFRRLVRRWRRWRRRPLRPRARLDGPAPAPQQRKRADAGRVVLARRRRRAPDAGRGRRDRRRARRPGRRALRADGSERKLMADYAPLKKK